MNNTSIIWGTGKLAESYVCQFGKNKIVKFVDPQKEGTFLDVGICKPDKINMETFDRLIICSSFVSEIITHIKALPIDVDKVFIYKVSSIGLYKLSSYTELLDGRAYLLPWQEQLDDINILLSKDIVYPDTYKELAKSIAYVFFAAVEGDFAEFGTCSGYSSSLISYVINFYSDKFVKNEKVHGQKTRNLHLFDSFDSFEGFPEATDPVDINSPHVISGAWAKGIAKGLSELELKELCSQFLSEDKIHIYSGWFKSTLQSFPKTTKLSLVHIDCDLYESTYDVLLSLLTQSQLSQGAILLFDNWFCNKASADFGEQKAWKKICDVFDVDFTNLGMYGCVSNKIIVHSYKIKA